MDLLGPIFGFVFFQSSLIGHGTEPVYKLAPMMVMMPMVSLGDCSGRRLLLQVVLLPPQSHFESGSLSAGQLRSTFPTCYCWCCQLLSSPPAGFNDLQSDLTTTSDNFPVRKYVRAESLSFRLATDWSLAWWANLGWQDNGNIFSFCQILPCVNNSLRSSKVSLI